MRNNHKKKKFKKQKDNNPLDTKQIDLEIRLDAILKSRCGGAYNINGIRYQILYSILRGLELYNTQCSFSSIRLEGIEDLDCLKINLNNEYIQIKTSKNSWNWAKLKEPVKNFLIVLSESPNSLFSIVLNSTFKSDVLKLSKKDKLNSNEYEGIKNKFIKLCSDVGASRNEAELLFEKIGIKNLPEKEIYEEIKIGLTNDFQLGSNLVDTYLAVLVSKFLYWAQERVTISKKDIELIRVSIGDHIASEEHQAYGRGLIDRISWNIDDKQSDFFEGKGTRPGQISAGVDVRRIRWLEKIDTAIYKTKICVLKSSSGQGKSALLYRYAYEYWRHEEIYILRVAETDEQAEAVCKYIRFIDSLGLPILLLIDDAGFRARKWPQIVRECVSLGIYVLMSVRHEDWFRFARRDITNWEVIEPTLDLAEAKQIYSTLKAENYVHSNATSPEWAYEKIGTPKLLIEYTYLLTHGRMIEDRLRDQIQQIQDHKEDPAKIEILRRVALADTLGTPVVASRLIKDISLSSDPQQLLKSLVDEYIALEETGILRGLHWVRSNHLTSILHEGYPNIVDTLLKTINSVLDIDRKRYIAKSLCINDLNLNEFITGLSQLVSNEDLMTFLGVAQ